MLDNNASNEMNLDSAGKLQRETLFNLIMKEKIFVEGEKLLKENSPGLLSELRFEKSPDKDEYTMIGKSFLGYKIGHLDNTREVEWVTTLSLDEVNEIFDIATKKAIPAQKRESNFQFDHEKVLEKAKIFLIKRLWDDARVAALPPIEFVKRKRDIVPASDSERRVWIVETSGADTREILNLIAEAIEFDDLAREWGGEAIPFSEFSLLERLVEDPIYRDDFLITEWQLDPVRDREELSRIVGWIEVLHNFGKEDGVSGWGERLIQRANEQRRVVKSELSRILADIGVAAPMIDREGVDRIVKGYELSHKPRGLDVERALNKSVEMTMQHDETEWNREWEQITTEIKAETVALKARELVRRALAGNTLVADAGNVAEIIHNDAKIDNAKLTVAELADLFRARWNAQTWSQAHKTVSLREAGQILTNYLSKYSANEREWGMDNVVVTKMQSWLNAKGIAETSGNHGWIEIMKANLQANPDYAIDTLSPRMFSEMLRQAKTDWIQKKKNEASGLIQRRLGSNEMERNLQKIDQRSLPEYAAIWRLWRRERGNILQKWAKPVRIWRELSLFEMRKKTRAESGGYVSIRFDDENAMQYLKDLEPDLFYSVRRLRLLTTGLGMKMNNDLEQFLFELAYQGEVSKRYDHESTYSPVGAKWRELLERRMHAVGDIEGV